MFFRHAIALLSFAFCMQIGVAKATTDTFRIHTDLPTINSDDNMVLDVFYSSDTVFRGLLQIRFYKYESDNDSILVLNKRDPGFQFKKGVNRKRLDFSETDSNTSYHDKFYEIIKRAGSVPPGSYKVFFTVKSGGHLYQSTYLHEIDSVLSPNSPLRKDINNSLTPKSKSFLGMRLQNEAAKANGSGAGKALANARNKVDRATKKRGFTSVHTQRSGSSFIDLYYKEMFAGRYEVKNKGSLNKQVGKQEDDADAGKTNPSATNNPDHPSLFSQYKKSNTEKKNKDEEKGEIGVTTNVSSGQEPYSGVDNNYYEVRGRVEVPICNLPVQIEGFYTSQDNNREVKSSYFKVHYDVDKMKDELGKTTSSYNNKFSETKSKGIGMNNVYQSAISKLEGQKTQLQNEVNAEGGNKGAGKPGNNGLQSSITADLKKQAKDTTGVKDAVSGDNETDSTSTVDSNDHEPSKGDKAASRAAEDKEKAEEKQKNIEEKQKKIEDLDKKIEKYKTLLAQNENTNHFDSAMAYDKTKDIGSQSDMTYKQMAKRGENLLPDGQVKKFVTGITSMDAGMFSKDESKYTMAGQNVKGASFGYDLGICEAGVAAGKTEYVGRDGSLDKYTFYSCKAVFKPAKKQKISLIYYGYSADQGMIHGDGFFKNASISEPGFFEPVSIISTNYTGSVSKYITINSEVATSIKNSNATDAPAYSMTEKMAYDFSADGTIPKTPISLQAAYDKTGMGFENSTLPVLLNGTEQIKLAGKDQFFRSILTVGIEYDRLIQHNFASVGNSTKWGFDIKTNFKRYPNLSLSYKPFTTFSSYTDTLNVPQRPLLGSVWTGKLSYQIKMHQKSVRFTAIYNKSSTTMDSASYGNTLLQFSTIYTNKVLTTSVSIGHMQMTGVNVLVVPTAPNNSSFLSLSGNYVLNKSLSVSGGQDFGMATFGFCKFSVNGGCAYKFKKKAITARLNLRYTTYELNAGDKWQNLYSGNIDLLYAFKAKKDKGNNFK